MIKNDKVPYDQGTIQYGQKFRGEISDHDVRRYLYACLEPKHKNYGNYRKLVNEIIFGLS